MTVGVAEGNLSATPAAGVCKGVGGVFLALGVAVFLALGVAVGDLSTTSAPGVCRDVGGVFLTLGVTVFLALGMAVGVAVGMAVAVGVAASNLSATSAAGACRGAGGVFLDLGVAVFLALGVAVFLALGVDVAVAVAVGVAAGDLSATSAPGVCRDAGAVFLALAVAVFRGGACFLSCSGGGAVRAPAALARDFRTRGVLPWLVDVSRASMLCILDTCSSVWTKQTRSAVSSSSSDDVSLLSLSGFLVPADGVLAGGSMVTFITRLTTGLSGGFGPRGPQGYRDGGPGGSMVTFITRLTTGLSGGFGPRGPQGYRDGGPGGSMVTFITSPSHHHTQDCKDATWSGINTHQDPRPCSPGAHEVQTLH
ncbi:hypothetical protein CRUP_009858 [Coryphaenoides rupestris]|nr:hypothetical protein CRUP_009858 [Coryphaenoides rupestris]